jgi:uncharacterized protein YndB with AHSA1/START domain
MRTRSASLLVLAAFCAVSSASAEIRGSAPNGFDVASVVTVKASPAAVYTAIGQAGRWWDPIHSYSLNPAANMTIELRAGGCLCERIPGGGTAQHLRVEFATPTRIVLRGAMGPLKGEGLDGALSFVLTPAGTGTRIEMRYAVGGFMTGGVDKVAAPVDSVINGLLGRLAAYADRRR